MDFSLAILLLRTLSYIKSQHVYSVFAKLPPWITVITKWGTQPDWGTNSKERNKLEMWILNKNLNKPPLSLNEFYDEGPLVSRKNFKFTCTTCTNVQKTGLRGEYTRKEKSPDRTIP